LTECDARRHTPFSPRERRLVRQHDVRSIPWPAPRRSESPCGSSCDVTRGASDRLLPSHVFVRAPAPRRFPSLASLRSLGRGLACFTAERFTSAESPRKRAPEPLTPLSPFSRRAKTAARSARVNRCASERRPGVSSVGQGSSPRNALSSARLRPWPATRLCRRYAGYRRRCTRASLFMGLRGPGPRPCVPLPAGGALLWARDIACRLLQPFTTRGHTRRASDPRARAGLSLRCSPAAMPAALVSPDAICTASGWPASHDPSGSWVGAARVKESAQPSANDVAPLPRATPGTRVVGMRACGTWSFPRARRTDRDPCARPLREKRHRTEDQSAFRRNGTLTRTEERSSGRA